VTIDPLTVALPILLTMVLGVSFWVSGLKNVRSKLVVLALLVSFVWIDSFLRASYPRPRTGLGWMVAHPELIKNSVPWTNVALPFIVMIAFGLVIYFLIDD
jgi:hypothetical protein